MKPIGFEIKDGPALDAPAVMSPAKLVEHLEFFRNQDREHLVGVYVNARSQVIAVDIVSVGSLSASIVHPREFFKGAFVHGAAAVIMAHNHPSGDYTPSEEDKDATKRMVKAGEILGIPLLDHVIVAARNPGFFSFKDAGLIK